MFDTLKLSELSANNAGILRGPSSTRPTIWIVEENGIRAVVKDFSTNKFLFRNTVGRFLVWREGKAYKKLRGIRGVPVLYRVVDGLALVIEEIQGRNLENLENEIKLSSPFFDALEELVRRFHRRGLAHCDLKRAPNTLIGSDGFPYIVDWAASISKEEFRLPLLGSIYRRFLSDDYLAVIKLKLRHAPETVRPDEKDRYHYRSGGEKFIRAVRDRLRAILQKAV